MQDLTVTLIQADLQWHDVDANLGHFNTLLQKIHGPTDLIVLPEMFNTGFSMNASALAENMDGKTVTWMKAKAKERNTTLIGSLIIDDNGNYYNRLIAASQDGSIKTYDKRHLFRMANEDETYTSGSQTILLNINGWNIKPLICYDLRFPVWARNKYDKSKGWEYDALIYVANWPAARAHAWKTLAIARAMENQSYVITCNRVGTDGNGHPYSGDSQVINSYGEALVLLDAHEYVETVTLRRSILEKHRADFPVGLDADEFAII